MKRKRQLWITALALVAAAGAAGRAAPARAAEPGGALAAAIDALVASSGTSKRPLRVGIAPFSGAEEAAARATAWATAKASEAGLEVYDRSWADVLGATGTAPEPAALAAALGWDAVFTGAVQAGARPAVEIALVDGASGRTLGRRTAEIPGEAPPAAPRALRCPARLAEGAAVSPDGVRARGPASGPKVMDLSPGIAIDRRVFVERRRADGTFDPPAAWDGGTLADGDHIAFFFIPRVGCRLAILSFETDGAIRRFFPASGAAGDGRVAPGTTVKIPPGPRQWFALESPAGEDRIVVYAEVEEGAKDPALVDAALAPTGPAAEKLRKETDAALAQSATDMRMRDAFRRVAAGAPLAGDGVRGKKLVAQEGGSVEVEGNADASRPLRLERIEGTERVVEEFRVWHR
jgi:hypothetical protein